MQKRQVLAVLQTNGSGVLSFASVAPSGTITIDNIQFPATQVASADANNLDDYEEGTFTPTILGTTTAGTFTPNSSYTRGRYTKIGRLVHVYFGLVFSSFTGTGNIKLGGLPFTSQNDFTDSPASIQGTSFTKPANSALLAILDGNATQLRVATYDTSSTTMARTSLAVVSAGEFYFFISYNT